MPNLTPLYFYIYFRSTSTCRYSIDTAVPHFLRIVQRTYFFRDAIRILGMHTANRSFQDCSVNPYPDTGVFTASDGTGVPVDLKGMRSADSGTGTGT